MQMPTIAPPPPQLMTLFAGVFCVLLLASIVGFALKHTLAR